MCASYNYMISQWIGGRENLGQLASQFPCAAALITVSAQDGQLRQWNQATQQPHRKTPRQSTIAS